MRPQAQADVSQVPEDLWVLLIFVSLRPLLPTMRFSRGCRINAEVCRGLIKSGVGWVAMQLAVLGRLQKVKATVV